MQSIDVAERRARLARRHRLAAGHRAGDVVEAAESIVCLHATDPASVYLSAWARVDGMAVPDMERALYVDRSLVKHLAMRRTLFVFPRATLSVAQAGASDRVADTERRRLIRHVEQAGLQKNGERWLKKASDRCSRRSPMDGRRRRRSSATRSPRSRARSPTARGSRGVGTMPVGPRVLTTLSAAGHDRAGVERRRLDDLTTALGLDGVLARRGDRALHGGRGCGGTGRAMAARVRSRDGRGHQVVARLHGRGGAEGAGRPRRGRGRSRRPDRIRAARRPGGDRPRSSRGRRSCRRSTRPRWAGSSATGTSARTRRSCSTPTATPDPPPGGTAGSWAAGARPTPARSSCSCSRTWARSGRRALEDEAARLTEWLAGTRVVARFPSPLSRSSRRTNPRPRSRSLQVSEPWIRMAERSTERDAVHRGSSTPSRTTHL